MHKLFSGFLLGLVVFTALGATTLIYNLPPPSNVPTQYLNGQYRWTTPAGGGGSAPVGTVVNTIAASGLLAVDSSKTNGIAATFAHVTNALGIFTGVTTTYVNGAGALSTPPDTSGNWTASGTTNSTLAGNASLNGLTTTNGSTMGALSVTSLTNSALTASRAVVSGADKSLASSATTATELGYVNGVTSAIQTQLDAKAATGNYVTALTGAITASGPGSAAASLGSFSSANLATALTDETGTGVAVFGTSPTFLTHIILSGGTVTASDPVWNATQTWNSSGVTFTGLKLNVTDSASAAASLLMDLQVGGSSKFSIAKTGDGTLGRDLNVARDISVGSALAVGGVSTGSSGTLKMPSSGLLFWSAGSVISSPSDGVIALQNNAQNSFTRLQFGGTTASFASLKRSTTTLITRLADDSADTVSQASGFSGTSTAAAVSIAATGWTNTYGINATVFLEGTAMTFVVYNGAGTACYTNTAVVSNATVPLQTAGAVVVTAGTGVSGRAVPW